MTVCVVDGQGGKIGSVIITRLKERLGARRDHRVGDKLLCHGEHDEGEGNRGASGENAIVTTVRKADVVIGTMNILLANSMLGEFTPRMAEAIADSRAVKFVLPVTQERIVVVGKTDLSIPQMIVALVDEVEKEIGKCAR